jgi:hypothetical protein
MEQRREKQISEFVANRMFDFVANWLETASKI